MASVGEDRRIRLLEGLLSRDPHDRVSACDELAELRLAPDALVALVRDPNPFVRAAVARGLSSFPGGTATRTLDVLARDSNPHVRSAAIEAIRLTREHECAHTLRAACRDGNRHVRAAAYRTLGTTGKNSDVGVLADGLNDDDSRVQAAAARGLADMRTTEAARIALAELLRSNPAARRGRVLDKLRWLLRAIEPLGPAPEAIATLELYLQRAEGVRSEAARVIGRLRAGQCRASLEDALVAGTPKLKLSAISALVSIGAGPSVAGIRPLIHDGNESVRIRACLALAAADDTVGARSIYELALSDEVPGVRIVALRAFARIMPHHGLEAWSRALGDADASVRSLAASRTAEELPDRSAHDALTYALELEQDPQVRSNIEAFLGRRPVEDLCIHELTTGTCSMCKVVPTGPTDRRRPSSDDDWDGAVPDLVYVSPGGKTFHRRPDCDWLWKGLENAARGRGGKQSPIFLVPVEEAAHARRATLCQTCFPDPEIVSDFGRLGLAR